MENFELRYELGAGDVDIVYNGDIPYICLTATSADELVAFFMALPDHVRPEGLPTVETGHSWSDHASDTEKSKAAARRLVEYLESREPVGRR